MCQMSMKLLAMFDQNPPHTFDKIVKKLITTKKLSKLDLDPKCQGHIRNQKPMIWGNKKHATPKKFEQGCLSNWCDADADSSKTICRPPPYGGGRHNNYHVLIMNFYEKLLKTFTLQLMLGHPFFELRK